MAQYGTYLMDHFKKYDPCSCALTSQGFDMSYSRLQARDKAMSPELRGEQFMRSPNLYGDPETTMRSVLSSIQPMCPAKSHQHIRIRCGRGR